MMGWAPKINFGVLMPPQAGRRWPGRPKAQLIALWLAARAAVPGITLYGQKPFFQAPPPLA